MPPLSQVIVNLLGAHIDPSKLRDHECNLPNMYLLEPFLSFDPLPHQIMEPPKHEPRLDRTPVHRAIGLRGCWIAIISSNYPTLFHHIVLTTNVNNLVRHIVHFLSTTSITLNKPVRKENKLHDMKHKFNRSNRQKRNRYYIIAKCHRSQLKYKFLQCY